MELKHKIDWMLLCKGFAFINAFFFTIFGYHYTKHPTVSFAIYLVTLWSGYLITLSHYQFKKFLFALVTFCGSILCLYFYTSYPWLFPGSYSIFYSIFTLSVIISILCSTILFKPKNFWIPRSIMLDSILIIFLYGTIDYLTGSGYAVYLVVLVLIALFALSFFTPILSASLCIFVSSFVLFILIPLYVDSNSLNMFGIQLIPLCFVLLIVASMILIYLRIKQWTLKSFEKRKVRVK
jgi:hypothetical protein